MPADTCDSDVLKFLLFLQFRPVLYLYRVVFMCISYVFYFQFRLYEWYPLSNLYDLFRMLYNFKNFLTPIWPCFQVASVSHLSNTSFYFTLRTC